MPLALYALTAGAFGIGVTEFVIMGLLLQVSADLGVSISAAGLLISGYALGVVIGAPLLTTLGNLACAIAPDYATLMAARVLTAFAHGTFFGVGSVVATSLVPADKKASAIAIMFTGLTVANILGVPFGTWLGQAYGWRATFWAVTFVGIAALAVIALFVPKDRQETAKGGSLSDELKVLSRRPVLLGLLTTVLGYAGVFAVFTYIAPILTEITGFSEAAVSPILLVFGGGLVLGNLLGGKLADRHLMATLLGSLGLLAVVLAAMTLGIHNKITAIAFVGLLGAAAFATVPPLQMWVLEKADGAGQSLASSLNIAAFNLGNALGAWLGGFVIDHGLGLGAVTWVAALLPASGLLLALWSRRLDRAEASPILKPMKAGV
jgi:MFS transporter, DHA1 family, inner membrane transport protein